MDVIVEHRGTKTFFFVQRDTIVIASQFAGRMCKHHSEWYSHPPVLQSNIYSYTIYKCERRSRNTTRRAAGWTPLFQKISTF